MLTDEQFTVNPDWYVTRAMVRYGGSFVAALGHAATCADAANHARLKAAFPDIADVVLAYRPVPKSKAARRRKRRAKKLTKEGK